MTKKDYVLTILENFEKHNDILPEHVKTLLQEVRQDIENVSADAFFLQTNGVVTRSAGGQPTNNSNPLYRLSEAYYDLKQVAEANRNTRPELFSAITQYEGLTNESEGYSPE